MSKILKCNFAKNEESAVQAIEAIEYVQASMFEQMYNDSISRLNSERDKDDKALSLKKIRPCTCQRQSKRRLS